MLTELYINEISENKTQRDDSIQRGNICFSGEANVL